MRKTLVADAAIPALMAGNAVILKHSAQTPLCAERFAEAVALDIAGADVIENKLK